MIARSWCGQMILASSDPFWAGEFWYSRRETTHTICRCTSMSLMLRRCRTGGPDTPSSAWVWSIKSIMLALLKKVCSWIVSTFLGISSFQCEGMMGFSLIDCASRFRETSVVTWSRTRVLDEKKNRWEDVEREILSWERACVSCVSFVKLLKSRWASNMSAQRSRGYWLKNLGI